MQISIKEDAGRQASFTDIKGRDRCEQTYVPLSVRSYGLTARGERLSKGSSSGWRPSLSPSKPRVKPRVKVNLLLGGLKDALLV